MTPFFSVIITVYNKEKFIAETINSVLQQTYSNYEILVVNDGSTDSSLEVIKRFTTDKIKVINQDNQGVSVARNIAINNSKGKFIALLDGDDLWHKDYLTTVYDCIKKFPKQFIFTTAIAHRYSVQKIVPAQYNFKFSEAVKVIDYFKNSLKHQILTSSSVVFKRDLVNQIGLFNTTIKSGEDIDYWIRIGSIHKIVFINKILVHYRYDDESLSNTTFDLSKKPKFDLYQEIEMKNCAARTYINKNRYSLAIMSKLYDDMDSYRFYIDSLDPEHLNKKQRILVNSPAWILRLLLKIKSLKGEKLYYRPLKSKNS